MSPWYRGYQKCGAGVTAGGRSLRARKRNKNPEKTTASHIKYGSALTAKYPVTIMTTLDIYIMAKTF